MLCLIACLNTVQAQSRRQRPGSNPPPVDKAPGLKPTPDKPARVKQPSSNKGLNTQRGHNASDQQPGVKLPRNEAAGRRGNSRIINKGEELKHVTSPKEKRIDRKTFSEISGTAIPQDVPSRELKKQRAYDKSRQSAFDPKLLTNKSPEEVEAMRKGKSKAASKVAVGGSSREVKKARRYDKAREIQYTQKFNTITSVEQRKANVKKQAALAAAAEKGNTMDRQAYRAMLKKRGKEMAASVRPGNTLAPAAHEKMMKAKSEDIADFEAGYTNTTAEKRARLRSFFFPKDYQANTTKEQHARAKSKSTDITAFAGRRKRSARLKVPNAHPSARPYSQRLALSSYSKRESHRRKAARTVAKNTKANQPVYQRTKVAKAKYSNVEKDLWYK